MVACNSSFLQPKKLLNEIMRKEIKDGIKVINEAPAVKDLDLSGLGLKILGLDVSDTLKPMAIEQVKQLLLKQEETVSKTAYTIVDKYSGLEFADEKLEIFLKDQFNEFLSNDLAQWCLKKDHENFGEIVDLTYDVFKSRCKVRAKLLENSEKALADLVKTPEYEECLNVERKKELAYKAIVTATYPNRACCEYMNELKYQEKILDLIKADTSILFLDEVQNPINKKNTIKLSELGVEIDGGELGLMLLPIIENSYIYAKLRLEENVDEVYSKPLTPTLITT